MSNQDPVDPRFDKAEVSDEGLVAAHEKVANGTPDRTAHYRIMPLVLLFAFSGLIFAAGIYLNRYSAHFSPMVYDERQPPGSGTETAGKVDPLVLGKKQYAQACAACHMPTGLGLPGIYPPLAGSEWVEGSEERLVRIVLFGVKGPMTVKGVQYSAAAMPPFAPVPGGGYNWSDERIAAVLTYIRQEWGNQSGAVTVEKVTALRKQEGARKEYSEAELLSLP